jgi:hypothetical protein
MDDFTQGYFNAALFGRDIFGNRLMLPGNPNPLMDVDYYSNYIITNVNPVTRLQMEADCERFQEENAEFLMKFQEELGWDDPGPEGLECGGNFWTARNNLPVRCSWREDSEEIGDVLIEAGRLYGKFTLYIARDNKIYGVGQDT